MSETCSDYDKQLTELEAEVERLRGALQEIANPPDIYNYAEELRRIARQSLAEKGDE